MTVNAGVEGATSVGSEDARKAEVEGIIKNHAAYGAIGGLIPVPVVDFAAVSAVQLRMIAQLCDQYRIPFSENAVKSIVSALLGSSVPQGLLGYPVLSLVKGVPVFGQLLGVAAFPAINGAATYALGRAFVWHFNRGGSLEDINPKEMSDRFKQELKNEKPGVEAASGQSDSGETGEGRPAV